MCFSARYRLEIALRRAIRYSPQDIGYWKSVLEQYDEWFQVSGFIHPDIIVYTNDKPFEPQLSAWGLIPDDTKSEAAARKIMDSTINARSETMFERKSFIESAEIKRCLIPAEGFYEHHHFKGKRFPYYIYRKDNKPLMFAGLWSEWQNPDTGITEVTCSIVTTKANPLLAKIHNKPKFSKDPRMPVILGDELENEWLKPLNKKEILELCQPFPDSLLDAHTVRRLSGKESPGNVPEANENFEYEELVARDNQLSLFG